MLDDGNAAHVLVKINVLALGLNEPGIPSVPSAHCSSHVCRSFLAIVTSLSGVPLAFKIKDVKYGIVLYASL